MGGGCYLFECAGFFEEVGGAGYDLDAVFGVESLCCFFVELEYLFVASSDEHEDGHVDSFECVAGHVGPASAGDDGDDGA